MYGGDTLGVLPSCDFSSSPPVGGPTLMIYAPKIWSQGKTYKSQKK